MRLTPPVVVAWRLQILRLFINTQHQLPLCRCRFHERWRCINQDYLKHDYSVCTVHCFVFFQRTSAILFFFFSTARGNHLALKTMLNRCGTTTCRIGECLEPATKTTPNSWEKKWELHVLCLLACFVFSFVFFLLFDSFSGFVVARELQ